MNGEVLLTERRYIRFLLSYRKLIDTTYIYVVYVVRYGI